MSFFQGQKDKIPINFSSIFSVRDKTFMICSREYNCMENEKTELISYFIFPAEQEFIFALTSSFIELLLTRIS